MKLGQIATIRTGMVLTRKKAQIWEETQGTYNLITLKNIEEGRGFSKAPWEEFASIEKLNGNHFTAAGDILVRLSFPNTAVCINEGRKGLLIPSSFAVIKLKTGGFIPEYIAWYLNSGQVKREYLKFQTGTAMATTNTKILSQLEIKAIPKEDQKLVARLQKLFFREKELLHKLEEEKEKLYKAVLQRLVQNEKGA